MSVHVAEKRPLGALGRMGAVAAFHVAFVVVIANSFGLVPTAKLPPDIGLIQIDEPPPIIDRVEPVKYVPQTDTQIVVPEPEHPPVATDPPEVVIQGKPATDDNIRESTGTGSALLVPEIVGPSVDPRRPLTRPRYPDEMIRGLIEGAVVVEILVQPNGRIGDARIVTSSGHEAFDRATLEEARRNWRMKPATQDGAPIPQWYRTRVVFKLTNR